MPNPRRKHLDVWGINYLPDLWPWSRLNWRNFCLVKIEGEVNECYWELCVAVLGVGFGMTWFYKELDHA